MKLLRLQSARPLLLSQATFAANVPLLHYQRRFFALPKYSYDDDTFEPNRFQVTMPHDFVYL